MLTYHRRGSCKELRRELKKLWPDAEVARKFVLSNKITSWMHVHESLLLYKLSSQYNFKGANILEIGTAFGGSAAIIASAAPLASIVTIDPNTALAEKTTNSLRHWDNIVLKTEKSWDYLSTYTGPRLDLILVDGSHRDVWQDAPWWNWLCINGLILFHDYSSISFTNIYKCVNELKHVLERQFDVYIGNSTRAFVGYYLKAGDPMVELLEGPNISCIDSAHPL